MTTPKLRVWWIPQVPMKAFTVGVSSVEEGVKIKGILADYDKFQYKHKVKPDYSNVGGLQQWNEEDQEWEDWFDEETGASDPEEWLRTRNQG